MHGAGVFLWTSFGLCEGVTFLVLCWGTSHARIIGSALQVVFASFVCWSRSPSLDLAPDLVLLGLCVWCALYARHYWTVWAASFALLLLATDLVACLVPRIGRHAYVSAELAWACALLAVLLYAVMVARLSGWEKRFGRPVLAEPCIEATRREAC